MNICICGTQDGYLHAKDCPYPYYGHDVRGIVKWQNAREHNPQKLELSDEDETLIYRVEKLDALYYRTAKVDRIAKIAKELGITEIEVAGALRITRRRVQETQPAERAGIEPQQRNPLLRNR